MTRGIYVEILIRAPMDVLWTHTQTPELHERWRSSSLKFWSAAPLSIIRDGGGYWKYIPTADGIRFLTCTTTTRALDVPAQFNRVWGRLFGYRGSFDVEWKAIAEVPRHVLPARQEHRD